MENMCCIKAKFWALVQSLRGKNVFLQVVSKVAERIQFLGYASN